MSIEQRPAHDQSYVPEFERGIALQDQGRINEARVLYQRLTEVRPKLFGAFNLLGTLEFEAKNYSAAEPLVREALTIRPGSAAAHNTLGCILAEMKRFAEADACFDQALSLDPDNAEHHLNKALCLARNHNPDAAYGHYRAALDRDPTLVAALTGIASIHEDRREFDKALAAYDQAIALDTRYAPAWVGRGNLLFSYDRHADALMAFDRAEAIKPDIDYLAGKRLHAALYLADWAEWSSATRRILAGNQVDQPIVVPFTFLALPSSAGDQLNASRTFVKSTTTSVFEPRAKAENSGGRIRVGYLSADLREHPVATVTASLFDLHDRNRFEIVGFSLGADDGSPMRRRLKAAFDRFIDLEGMSERRQAETIAEAEIDILVDLQGYTQHCRPGIAARRPAPIQVNAIGYPGTMGADFIDYIIADPITIDRDDHRFYQEKVVNLPDCYLPSGDPRPVAPVGPSRADVGLPATGFVFCAFNNVYKINPDIFDVWMRILGAVEDSVLWLQTGNAAARANLRREAAARGIAGERIIFAARVDRFEDHLARYRLADLFLDTIYYNAHSTAIDALWVGLPVLTCIGSTFAGRVAASVVTAAGMPDLVTQSLEDYEAEAIRLARDPAALAQLRARLGQNRDTSALFDMPRYTRHLEAAFETMCARHRSGAAPASFDVTAID